MWKGVRSPFGHPEFWIQVPEGRASPHIVTFRRKSDFSTPSNCIQQPNHQQNRSLRPLKCRIPIVSLNSANVHFSTPILTIKLPGRECFAPCNHSTPHQTQGGRGGPGPEGVSRRRKIGSGRVTWRPSAPCPPQVCMSSSPTRSVPT